MSKVQEITAEQFNTEVLGSSVPVLVDFYATWCAPCRMLTPYLEQLAQEFEGRIKFVKIDVDRAPELAYRFDIRAVPTLILFHNGRTVDAMVGLVSPNELRAKLQSALSPWTL